MRIIVACGSPECCVTRKRYDGMDPHGHESHTEPSDGTYADIPAADGDEGGYMDVNVDQHYDESL